MKTHHSFTHTMYAQDLKNLRLQIMYIIYVLYIYINVRMHLKVLMSTSYSNLICNDLVCVLPYNQFPLLQRIASAEEINRPTEID